MKPYSLCSVSIKAVAEKPYHVTVGMYVLCSIHISFWDCDGHLHVSTYYTQTLQLMLCSLLTHRAPI